MTAPPDPQGTGHPATRDPLADRRHATTMRRLERATRVGWALLLALALTALALTLARSRTPAVPVPPPTTAGRPAPGPYVPRPAGPPTDQPQPRPGGGLSRVPPAASNREEVTWMGHAMNFAATLLALVPAGVYGIWLGNRLRRRRDDALARAVAARRAALAAKARAARPTTIDHA